MKTIVLIILVNISGLVLEAQVNKQQQVQREKDKVMVFSSEERANLQLWFYEQTQRMGLSEEVNTEYERIFYDHIYEMSRLNDKDKDLTDDEMHERFDTIVDKLNMQMKQLLNQEQYIQHLENFGEIVRSIYGRMNWTN
jgi:hypothetical protein